MLIAVQMDALLALSVHRDSTLLLMREAQARGHRLYSYTPDRLFMRQGRVFACARRAQFRGFLERAVALGELRDDADLDYFVDVALGTIIWRSQIATSTFDHLVEDQARTWDLIVESIGTPKGKRALAQRRREGG